MKSVVPRRLARALLLIAGALGAVTLVHHPMFRGGLGFVQTDEGDARFVAAILEHTWRWLLREPANASLFDPPFFFPAKNVLAYSEVLLGGAPLYWPFRWVGVRMDTAFQLWMMLQTALNFVAFQLLLARGLKLGALASTFGALLFAAAAVRTNFVNHIQLFLQLGTVLFIWAVVRFFEEGRTERQRRADALFAVLAFTFQLWSSFYMAWFLAVAASIALLAAFAFAAPRRRLLATLRTSWSTVLVACVAVALLALPLLLAYLGALRELGGEGRPLAQVMWSLPRWQSFLNHGPWHWLYARFWREPIFLALPAESEQRLGVGVLTALVCLVGFAVARRRPAARMALVVWVALIAFTLHLGGSSLYPLLHAYFPGAKGIRAVSRVALVALIPLSVAFAFAIEAVGKRVHVLAALALGLLCMAEQGVTTEVYDKARSWRDVQRLAQRVSPACQSFLFQARRAPHPHWKLQIDAMWAALQTGVPTVNGYSGNSPPGWELNHANIGRPDEEMRLMRYLDQWAAANPGALRREETCWIKLESEDVPLTASLDVPAAPSVAQVGSPLTFEVVALNSGLESWEAFALSLPATGAPGPSAILRAVSADTWVQTGERIRFTIQLVPQFSGRQALAFELVGADGRRIGWPSPLVALDVRP